MSETSPRGRFVWYDLLTTDPGGAEDFYKKVAGWGTQEWSSSGAKPYTMWTTENVPIGGVMQMAPEMQGAMPPHWIGYVAVPNVDDSAKQAETLGGRVLTAPMDIPEVGRFAVISDPQGAAIAIFTPKDGAQQPEHAPIVGEISWHELTTTDHKAAYNFYQTLFGWDKTGDFDMGEPMGVYQMYGRNNQPLGGMFTNPADMPMPPNWLYYIRVSNVDEAAERVKALGGQVLNGPMDVPGGDRIAQCLDPQGAAFAVHSVAAPRAD
jgi:predicted enzyme related to lactoylglutathione lyase